MAAIPNGYAIEIMTQFGLLVLTPQTTRGEQ
jgi:hypothetical protein